MKRNLQKIKKIKEYIKENYLIVSDREIAKKFEVSVRSVSVARRRLGLKKDKETTIALRSKERDMQIAKPNFDQFWSG